VLHDSRFLIRFQVLTHLFYVLNVIRKTPQEEDEARSLAAFVDRKNARTSTGDSLLHLVVSKSNTMKSASFMESETTTAVIFPDVGVARLLLEAGADVDAVNHADCTPLHVACTRSNYQQSVVQVLLSAGAHIDRRSASGNQPQTLLSSITECTINPMQFVSLKCLAARRLQEQRIPVSGQVPESLVEFVRIH
jgi:ankyrin repeat protein